MKIINPSVKEFVPQNPIQHIERCGRVCYKSEDKITEGSAEKFVGSIVKRGHLSVTEHYRFTLEIGHYAYNILCKLNPKYLETHCADNYLISGSSRGFYELWKSIPDFTDEMQAIEECINTILYYAPSSDILFPGFVKEPGMAVYELVNPQEFGKEDRLIHGWHTLKFTCDRGVTHELVRHRPCSFSQESTRYCNYSGDKFSNEITVVQPSFWENDSDQMFHWRSAMRLAESHYLDLIEVGATPQEARSVLPNSLKTELVITATNEEWLHLLKLRCSKAAHPQCREVCDMAKLILQTDDPEIYGGL